MLKIRNLAVVALCAVMVLSCKKKNNTPPVTDPMPTGMAQSQSRLLGLAGQLDRIYQNNQTDLEFIRVRLAQAYVVTGLLTDLGEGQGLSVFGFEPQELNPPAALVATMGAIDEAQTDVAQVLKNLEPNKDVASGQVRDLLASAALELQTLRRTTQDVYVWKIRQKTPAGASVEREFTVDAQGPSDAKVTFIVDSTGPTLLTFVCQLDPCAGAEISVARASDGVVVGSGTISRVPSELNIDIGVRGGYLVSVLSKETKGQYQIKVKQKAWLPANFRFLSQVQVEDAQKSELIGHELAHVIQQRAERRLGSPEAFPGSHGLDRMLIREMMEARNMLTLISHLKPGDQAPTDLAIAIDAYNNYHRLMRGRKSKVYSEMTDTDVELKSQLKTFHDTAKNSIGNIR